MRFSLKVKLIFLPALSVVAIAVIVGMGGFYYGRIETARATYDSQTEQSQADSLSQIEGAYQKSSEQTAEGMVLRTEILDIVQVIQHARISGKAYLQFYEDAHRVSLSADCAEALKRLQAVGQRSNLDVGRLAKLIAQYQESFSGVVSSHARNDELGDAMSASLEEMGSRLDAMGYTIQEKESELMMEGEELDPQEKNLKECARDSKILALELETHHRNFLLTGDETYIEKFNEKFTQFGAGVFEMFRHISAAVENEEYIATADFVKTTMMKNVEMLAESRALFLREAALVKELDSIGTDMLTGATAIMASASERARAAEAESLAAISDAKSQARSTVSTAKESSTAVINNVKKSAVSAVGATGVIGTVALLAFSVFLIRGITTRLGVTINMLRDVSHQVDDAATQVSASSQQLADGAGEQASSLEETSSALEQMAAMASANAENAKEANSLSGQARDAAKDGDRTMVQLNLAMTGINEASGQISKIIKVIEEIAFQTNLLALNAAVEAARAGEHGKGFAVVADEVRTLAQRCAQAARETTGLIEGSVSKAKVGADVAAEVGKVLGTIAGDVSRVTDLIDKITEASDEQAQGVRQLNIAVSQMDTITQQNASGAEESASASAELSDQAATVKNLVDELSVMVGGAGTRTK